MKITNMNSGNYIPFAINGSTVVVGTNPGITVDMAASQTDAWVTIDLSHDASGNLIKGVGTKYVANVIIPPKSYKLVDTPYTGPDGTATTIKVKQALPLNVSACTLQLWSV